MTKRYAGSGGEDLEAMSVRFASSTKTELTVASALLNTSINSIVNTAVEQYLAKPNVKKQMAKQASLYQETIDRLAGGSS